MSHPRSGRTTRMLDEALRLIRETNKKVIVIAGSHDPLVQQFKGLMEDAFVSRRRLEFMESIPPNFDWFRMVPEGYDFERTVVLIDHWVIEGPNPFLRQMYLMMTQFDA